MEGSIKLSSKQHKIAVGIYRSGGDARVARRAHVLLLLHEGISFRQVMEITSCSSDLVAGVKAQFLTGGVEAAVAESTDARLLTRIRDLNYAGWMADTAQIVSCQMHLPMPDRNATTADFFTPLVRHIENLVLTGEAPYPAERTLLTSGMVIAGIDSAREGAS